MLTVLTRLVDDALVLELSGRMDGGQDSVSLRDALRTGLQGGSKRVLLDLREVEWINSLGVGHLVAALVTVRQRGGRIGLLGRPGRVDTVLRTSGLVPDIVPMDTEEAEALGRLMRSG